MSTATREEWLASLKVGDQVATYYRYTGYTLHTVAKRTPTGRVTLENGCMYNKDGIEQGGSKWNHDQLEEVTSEVLADIEHGRLVSAVHAEITKLDINHLRLLSKERLEELLAVLKKGE